MTVDAATQAENGATQTPVDGTPAAGDGGAPTAATPLAENAGIFADSGTQSSGETQTEAPDNAATTDDKGPKDTGNFESALGAPEAYTFDAPEGTELDTTVSEKFAQVARELNLSQTAAQKILAEMTPVMAERNAENQKVQIDAFLDKTVAEWAAARDSDPEVGGVALQANLVLANKALKQFGTPALEKLLSENRLHNHPEIARLLYRVGKAIEPDGAPFDGRGTGDTKPAATSTEAAAQKLYG